MRILYDENLSPSLISRLSDIFPDSDHVRNLGLTSEDDALIWDYALNSFDLYIGEPKESRYFSTTRFSVKARNYEVTHLIFGLEKANSNHSFK